MKTPIRWVRGEIASWEKEGLVSADQSRVLLARYPEPPPSNLGLIIFAGMGAVIVGFGVILLLAHNWQAIPRFIKLALILVSISLAHGSGIWLMRSGRTAVGEAITLLGTMLFGAGIWLIAQIYHIEEHYPNAFLIWSLGALGMAWALPSISQAALATLLVTIWCGMEGFNFDRSMHAAPLIIVGWVGLLAFRRQSAFLLTVAIPAFFLSVVFVLFNLPCSAHVHGGLILSVVLNFSVALIALGHLVSRLRFFEAAPRILVFYGHFFALGLIYLLTFPRLADDFLPSLWAQSSVSLKIYTVFSVALATAVWLRLAVECRRGRFDRPPVDQWLYPLAAVLAAAHVFLPSLQWEDWFMALPFNIVLLALIIALMTRGCRQGLKGPTVVGSILLILLMFARYFDLFDSLLIRGTIFIGVGAAIFVQGLIYQRVKRRQKKEVGT
jgi:uncharacterized membrane protein